MLVHQRSHLRRTEVVPRFDVIRTRSPKKKKLDGLYIVRSNVESEVLDAAQTVRAYKDLLSKVWI